MQTVFERGCSVTTAGGWTKRAALDERALAARRVLVYAAVAILTFALAAGMGMMGALTLRGDVARLLEGKEPRPAGEQDTGRTQQRGGVAEDSAVGLDEAADEQGIVASRREAAEYVGTVGAIQTRAVEMFLKSHEKLSQYDALTAADVEELKANETALQDMDARAASLAPPASTRNTTRCSALPSTSCARPAI